MYVIAITFLVCFISTCVDSIATDDDYSSSSSDYQSSVDYVPLLPMEVFALNDKNGNGFITPKEYRKANPSMTDIECKLIFDSFDRDQDGRISLSEFTARVQHSEPELQENCLTAIMRTCSQEFIHAVQKWDNKQGDAMCHCLPLYRDCIRNEREACSAVSAHDMEEEDTLNDQVETLLQRFEKALCQETSTKARPSETTWITTTPASSTPLTEARGIRQVRSSRTLVTRRYRPRSRRQSCIVSTVKPCNRVFIASLQAEDEDPCHSLVKYRQCVHRSTRRCNDPNLPHIQRAIKFLAKQHRRVKICARYSL